MTRTEQKGFTIIELILAMTFFSFILLFFSFGFIQISRTFQRGQTIKRVTQSGRAVIEDISRNVRLSSKYEYVAAVGGKRLCLSNGVDYAWNLAEDLKDLRGEVLQNPSGNLITDSEFNLVKSEHRGGSCSDSFVRSNGVQEVEVDGQTFNTQGITSLLDEGVSVQALSIEQLPGGGALRIDLTVSSDSVGSIETNGKDATCSKFINQGDEYCDVVRFSTIVNFRLQ